MSMVSELELKRNWKETRLGTIPANWDLVFAKEYCIKVADGTHDTPKPQKEGKCLVTSKHIKDGKVDLSTAYKISLSDYNDINKRSGVDRWDVLLSMIGTVGEVALIQSEPGFAIKNVGLFKCGSEIKAKWLSCFLRSKIGQDEIKKRLSGTTQKYITLGSLRDLSIVVPGSDVEQQQLVSVLFSYDDLIEVNEKRIRVLEEMTQRLYVEWFIKFKFPNHKKIVTLDNSAEYDQIPEGWEIRAIDGLLDRVKRKHKIQTNDYQESGLFPIVDQGKEFIAGYTDYNESIYDEDLIVFGDHTRCFKYCNFPFACGADGTQLLKTNDPNRMPQILLYFAVLNAGLQNYDYARHFKFLKSLKILLPDVKTAKKFELLVKPIYEQIKNLRAVNYEASKILDHLIPQLVTGGRLIK